jgi:hypothetical protein
MSFRITGRLTLLVFTFAAADLCAGVPKQISHQGVVAVNGQRFNGTGTFYFALVGNDGAGTNLWTNDGTQLGSSNRPTVGVQLSVADGVYAANLGGGTMKPIPPQVLNNGDVVLRIWFDDGNPAHGVQQLTPDQTVSSTAYAMNSELLSGYSRLELARELVPIGTIQAWHKSMTGTPALPNGWAECSGQILNDPDSPYHNAAIPNLNEARCITSNGEQGCYSSGSFLRGGLSSGDWQDASSGKGQEGNWSRYTWDPIEGEDMSLQNQNVWAVRPSILVGPTFYTGEGNLNFVRPVNMSVVWIMRVK